MNKNKKNAKSKFKGKVVLITGASSGIGKQAAIDFADNSAETIVLVSRSKTRLEETKQILRQNYTSELLVYSCDVSCKANVLTMGKDLLGRLGHIDILVNNAGIGLYDKVLDQRIDDMESITFTNYLGTVYCTKVFLESMIYNGTGHIVNVASVAASFGVAGLAAYCASKYAILGFSEALYHELHGTGVGVTVVSPIGVKTNFFNHESFARHIPNYTGFMLSPKIVSKAILSAANSSRLEIMVPFYIRAGVWFKHTIPYLVNPIVGSLFNRQLRNKSKFTGNDEFKNQSPT
ncbi:MAG TPA: SDR family NAD(P)-dependent oxidoreductase [Nitrososphaeraceae archaeon]|nr:SDR family NAD(P)-dependent oxidoreductase [Nitrososphaeraceae archaeon]